MRYSWEVAVAEERGPQLVKIDISVVEMDQMVRFYRDALGGSLTAIPVGEFTLYVGRLPDGLGLALAPEEMTGVKATGNRIQLNFRVPDVGDVFERALRSGGTELEPVTTNGTQKTASVRDPDGNSVVLVQ